MLSTGNAFTELKLNKSTNTLIIGQNGAGKSTILDALTFALFNKPFRKINKPQLMNSINDRDCVVELEFMIGKKSYKIVRGIKPNIFEIYCDNKLINQDAKIGDYQEYLENVILKLNYKSFTQVVVLGSAAFVPFMQLSAADRRTVIEDLLDISIFSSMNKLVKDRVSTTKDNQKTVDYEIKLTGEKIAMQMQNLEDQKKNSEAEIAKKLADVSKNEEFIAETMKTITLVDQEITALEELNSEKMELDEKSNKLLRIESKFEDNLVKLKSEIRFYSDNDNCPTCQQTITEEHKCLSVNEKTKKIDEISGAMDKLTTEISKVSDRLGEIAENQRVIRSLQSDLVKLNTQVTSTNSYNTKVLQEVEQLKQCSISLEKDNNKLKELTKALNASKKTAEELSSEKQYLEFAATLLKDTGIKTKIIKQYLPVMNKLINKFLTSMEFFVNFNLNESFEETIKSRHRDEFSYTSFSEGEKQKIDIALLLTWRQVAKMKNSVSTNLLILDEVFDSSLDANSVELLMQILGTLSNDTNIFVISHKGDQLFDKFRSVIRFEKKNNFSQVVK